MRWYVGILTISLGVVCRAAMGDVRITEARGGVEVQRVSDTSGGWRAVVGTVTLKPGDRIRTGAGGSAQMPAADGTIFTLGPSTILEASDRGLRQAQVLPGGVARDRWIDLAPGVGLVLYGDPSPQASNLGGSLYVRRAGRWSSVPIDPRLSLRGVQ